MFKYTLCALILTLLSLPLAAQKKRCYAAYHPGHHSCRYNKRTHYERKTPNKSRSKKISRKK